MASIPQDNSDKKNLEQLFDELTGRYQAGLGRDIEFDKLKEIYMELKEVRRKLKNLKDKEAGNL